MAIRRYDVGPRADFVKRLGYCFDAPNEIFMNDGVGDRPLWKQPLLLGITLGMGILAFGWALSVIALHLVVR